MVEDQRSWRKAHSPVLAVDGERMKVGNSALSKEQLSHSIDSWRSKGLATVSDREAPVRKPARHPKQGMDAGPAAPLNPLHIGHSKPLPHPSTYGGSDNWALTPTGSLPSLPGTPSKAMHSMGWQHIALPNEEQHRESAGSRELSAARALLNRRNEDRPLSSSSAALPRQSPKRQPSTLQSSSPSMGATGALTGVQMRPVSPLEGPSTSRSPSAFTSPPLRHQDSTTSLASSSLLSLGAHPLSHSRRSSQALANSPAGSVVSSSLGPGSGQGPGPGYRVYRPPHLRRKDSVHALKPKVAHYDRVRTPSLRGHSRSPDPNSLPARSARDESRTAYEATPSGRPLGKRRLSSLGSFNSSIYDGGLDSRSLFGKLATSNSSVSRFSNRKFSDASSSYRPDESLHFGETDHEARVLEREDEMDLTVEDLMMQSNSLTDEYCLSRTNSLSDGRQVVDIFEVGDRLGPGMMHDGLEVTIAETSEGFRDQNADLSGSQLEVVKKLGEGSYAVVYLVKEVSKGARASTSGGLDERPYGVEIPKAVPDFDRDEGDETVQESDDVFGTTLKASESGRLASEEPWREDEPKSFALKCLCKRDLSDEMLKVQRLEATIHQSIPRHPAIVTLYRTYETAEWLFLILEYCPGQDLFYWLEQAHDMANLGAETPMVEAQDALDIPYDGDTTAMDATPPSPSLLASTESRFLLSTRRLKLISRMFQQMCQAISFCHERGISHRDIKPENFIVEDRREAGNGHDSIKVKLTDFGLAVAQDQCIDFDCGSKPYMSYECRNNGTKWYDPRQSDIWSLGIVLLNLIFHRNPFVEPNVDNCASFASYVDEPVRYLVTAFRGLKWQAASFLAENVFCDVSEGLDDIEGPKRRRISAAEFGEWASNLSEHMESPRLGSHRMTAVMEAGADEDITSPIWHSRSPTSSMANSLGASPAGGGDRINSSIHRELASMGIHQKEWENYGTLFPDESAGGITANQRATASRPTSSVGSPLAMKGGQGTADAAVSPSSMLVAARDAHEDDVLEEQQVVEHRQPARQQLTISIGEEDGDGEEDEDGDSLIPPPSASSTTGNPKRRKRGARKGRTLAKQELKRSQSVENLSSHRPLDPGGDVRDQILKELAEASQSLAREMSKALKGGAPQNAATAESPTSDTPSIVLSSGASVGRTSVASRASTQYTNFSWQEQSSRRPTSIYSIRGPGEEAVSPVAASAASWRERADRNGPLEHAGRLSAGAVRTGGMLPPPPAVAANWRERNGSNASVVSSSFFSDAASIYSTASAPAALAARRQQTTSSTTSNRGTLATASNLGTISEKASRPLEKDLDASYLAEIFGGRVPQSSRAKGKASKPDDGVPHSRDAAGIKNGALAAVIPSSSRFGAHDASAGAAGPQNAGQQPTASSAAQPEADPSSEEAGAPRKKMLGKFLLGVKNYNRGVRAAPHDDVAD